MNTEIYLDVTWGRALRIWWRFTWQCVVAALLAGLPLGTLAAITAVGMGQPNLAQGFGSALGYIGSVLVSMWIMRRLLCRPFPEFSLRLVPHESRDHMTST